MLAALGAPPLPSAVGLLRRRRGLRVLEVGDLVAAALGRLGVARERPGGEGPDVSSTDLLLIIST